MKIELNTNFYLQGISPGGEIELEGSAPTLRSLLQEISPRSRLQTMDPKTHQLEREAFSVYVNGCALDYLPQGLGTPLQKGDAVIITYWMDMLGGG